MMKKIISANNVSEMFDTLQLDSTRCALQFELTSFVTMATYWVPGPSKVALDFCSCIFMRELELKKLNCARLSEIDYSIIKLQQNPNFSNLHGKQELV